MVLPSTLLASLALAITAQAGPIAQADITETGIAPADVVSGEPTATAPTSEPSADESPALQAAADEQGKRCDLKATEPSSWADSGAEQYLSDWLKEHGSANWLQDLVMKEGGGNTAVMNCASTSSNSCNALQGSADCNKYEYYFVRLMASQINSVFKDLHENLQSKTLSEALNVGQIFKDFKMPEPSKSEIGKLLGRIALGPSVLSTLLGFTPAPGPIPGMISLIGTAISTTGSNLDEKMPELPKYEDIAPIMNTRLRDFFTTTEETLGKTLEAIFGESSESEEDSNKRIRDMIDRMGQMGVQDLDKDASSPISELLKGGGFLVPVQKSQITGAIRKAFATIQHGVIGSLLAAHQVYVEEELPAANEGPGVCTALGTLAEKNTCFVLKRKDPTQDGNKRPQLLEEKQLQALGKYGLDIHTLIRNVVECNNGQADKSEIRADGTYPKCFFGMTFAQRVNEKDFDHWNRVVDGCVNYFRNPKSLPDWLSHRNAPCDIEVPEFKPCKVIFKHEAVWTEAALDRYRIVMDGENVDISQICPYAHDGRRCAWGSNRQCYFNDYYGKYVLDINFAKGSGGHDSYNTCFDELRKAFTDDNKCTN